MNKIYRSTAVFVGMLCTCVGVAGGIGLATAMQEPDPFANTLVVRNGTLIANPSALTTAELLDSDIFSFAPEWVGIECDGQPIAYGHSMSDLPNCRQYRSFDAIRADRDKDASPFDRFETREVNF